jgi:hypothetical protein
MRAATSKRKNAVKTKPYIFGVDKPDEAKLKIGVNLESVGTLSSQLAGLILSLVKFELIRRDAYNRWRLYLNQVGLRLKDLIAYLDVLHDDQQLINALKNYYVKTKTPTEDKIELKREANELKELLIEKIKQVKVLNDFPIHGIRNLEQIVE